jgi:hypothetical protein
MIPMLYKNVMPTMNWGHKHIGDTIRNILSIRHQQSPSNKSKKKRKRKRKDVPQTQLFDWKTLKQPSIINVGMGSKRKKRIMHYFCTACI